MPGHRKADGRSGETDAALGPGMEAGSANRDRELVYRLVSKARQKRQADDLRAVLPFLYRVSRSHRSS